MPDKHIHILLVEDDAIDRMAFERFIRAGELPYDYTFADSLARAREILKTESFDVILADYQLGDGTCLDLLPERGDTPVIVVTGTGDEETAVLAMKQGASDYLIKDPQGNYLVTVPHTVTHALDRKRAEDQLHRYHAHLEQLVKERTAKLEAEIEERKVAQAEREQLIAQLETQNAELERYAYTISHDLKTPLLTISWCLGALEENLAEGDLDEVKRQASRVICSSRTMLRMLDELLELSRIGRTTHPAEYVPLQELVAGALELLSNRIAEKAVHVEVAPELPVLRGDRQGLGNVVQNLVENAVKYLGEGPDRRVEIGSRHDGDQTVCFVRDNGIGIAPRHQERIFGLFNQLDARAEGTGVGLALARRIIEVHGGRLWCESEGEGRGSTFCFTVPDQP